MLLKTDLHLHTKEDPIEKLIRYNARELINTAIRKGFKVLAITNHNSVFYDVELDKYAAKQGLTLIPGTEASVNRRHILLYCSKDIN